MAYFYIDDGYPESADYENNYIDFDTNDPECFQKMIELAQVLESVPAHERKSRAERFLERKE